MTLLEASDIQKSYSGVRALKGVSFSLDAGEVHALVGENGAGKSTLIKIMTGVVTPDSGALTVAGHAITHHTPSAARAAGIAAVYQQPALFPDLTVTENIAFALESGGLWRIVNWKERTRRAAELLERCGADSISPGRMAGTLSMPEQQIVEIAKAIGSGARILIFDEPTASLTDREVVVVGPGAKGPETETTIAVPETARVLRDGKAIPFDELKEGEGVTVSVEKHDGRLTAKSLQVGVAVAQPAPASNVVPRVRMILRIVDGILQQMEKK